jgi:foldase protein PrsA
VSNPARSIAALGAVLFAAGGLAACGGSSGDAVVQVNGQTISKTAYTHWLGVAASSSTAALPGRKTAKPVVPEPPAYTACIAHLKAIEPKPAKGQKPRTEPQLKTQCEQQYTALKQQVLGFLIGIDWVFGESEAQGIKLADKEVGAQFNKLKKQQFPTEAKFREFTAATGQTVSDLLLRVKYIMLETKLQEKIAKNAKKAVSEAEVAKYYAAHKSLYGRPATRGRRTGPTKTEAASAQVRASIKQQLAATRQQAALAKFVKEFKDRWKGRTECRTGYVVQDCKEYAEPKLPASPLGTGGGAGAAG